MLWLGIWILGIGRVLFGFKSGTPGWLMVIALTSFRWTGTGATLVSKLGGVPVPNSLRGVQVNK